jgi:UV DNA damage endonuclease
MIAVAQDQSNGRLPPAQAMAARYRLGVGARLVGAPLRTHDSRRWAQQPHLSVSLAYVRDIFAYLESRQVRFYRLSSNLAPYATHTGLPPEARARFLRQVDECSTELAAIGDSARAAGLRLTMHPAQHVCLDSMDDALAARSLDELALAARLMEAMGLDDASVLVVHAASSAGGAADMTSAARRQALAAALTRCARRVDQMAPSVRRRVVVENDDRCADLGACLWLHRRTGLPVVFDLLHHRCLNPAAMAVTEALAAALSTWPASIRPKVHLSSPRTELRVLRRNGRDHIVAPLPNQHADFLNPFECIELLRVAQSHSLRAFDILLEVKAHDLALLRLRAQIAHFAPELAALVG